MGTDNLFWKGKAKAELKRKQYNRGNPKDRILIVCEGEKTEPNYFNGFRLSNVLVVGSGYNTDSLVNKAIELRNEAHRRGEKFDQVWCVFDRDNFPPQNFNNAFILAKRNSINIAYTNEAFELWYLLHFHYYNTGLSREQYKELLTPLLGFEYKKNDPRMYEILLEKQNSAINNACKLLTHYTSKRPVQDNPSTTVHQLVSELNKWKGSC